MTYAGIHNKRIAMIFLDMTIENDVSELFEKKFEIICQSEVVL